MNVRTTSKKVAKRRIPEGLWASARQGVSDFLNSDSMKATPDRGLSITLIFLSALLFGVTTLVHNWRFYHNFCADGFDFAVYLEVIRNIARGVWNPFCSIIQVPHLNDHWDPIYYFVSWISSILPLNWTGWLIELVPLLLCAGCAVGLIRKAPEKAPAVAMAFIFFFINRELFEAAFYPLHTSTFGLLPVMVVAAWLSLRDWNQKFTRQEWLFLAGIGVLLSLFKQTLSVMPLGLSLGLLLFKKQRRAALGLVPIFLLVSWFTMKGRVVMVGPIAHHLDRVSFSPQTLLSLYNWDLEQFVSIFKFLLELTPFFYLLYLGRKTYRTKDFVRLILIAAFFSPYILGQVLSGSFIRHYNAILVGFVTTLIFSFVRPQLVTRRVLWATFLLAIVFSVSKFKKAAVLTQNHNFVPACVHTVDAYEKLNDRNDRLKQAMERIRAVSYDHPVRVLSNGNLLPNLLTEIPNLDAYHIGTSRIVNVESVDWIFVEYGDYGYPPPAHPPGDWAKKLKEIVIANHGHIVEYAKGVFLARGPVPIKALTEFSSDEIGMKDPAMTQKVPTPSE